MAKNKVSEWSSTASSNTDVGGIDINEGCAPANLNNAIREVMAQVKDMQTGADSDPFVVGGNLSVTGTSTLTGATTVSGVLTASGGVTGNVIGNLTGNQSGGSISATTGTFSGVVSLSGNVNPSFSILARTGSDGGAFLLQKASTSTLSGDVVVDTATQDFRFFESSGTNRGAKLDLTTCAANAGSVIVTSSNISTYAPASLTRATAQNTTSGTYIDFTGIPSTVKRITVMLQGVSTSGSSNIQIQLGTSSGVTTTGYLGQVSEGSSNVFFNAGFVLRTNTTAANTYYGIVTFAALSSNVWVESGNIGTNATNNTASSGGSVSLASVLDRIRITTVNGTDTFDAGSVNIMYE